jgi:hypothetical protein
LRQQTDRVRGQALQIEGASFDVTADVGRIGQVVDTRDHEGQTLLPIEDPEAPFALHD